MALDNKDSDYYNVTVRARPPECWNYNATTDKIP